MLHRRIPISRGPTVVSDDLVRGTSVQRAHLDSVKCDTFVFRYTRGSLRLNLVVYMISLLWECDYCPSR